MIDILVCSILDLTDSVNVALSVGVSPSSVVAGDADVVAWLHRSGCWVKLELVYNWC